MVQLLDCTLRDGAHVTSGNFGYDHIIRITDGLSKASLDYVELGFLKSTCYIPDVVYYPRIENAYEILEKLPIYEKTEYALMARADEFDLEQLSECNGKIKYIRIAFYSDFMEKAMEFAKEVMEKGYFITLNLINTPGCTENERFQFLELANHIHPYAVTIVDTFGVLMIKELKKIIDDYHTRLASDIKIGIHVHENLSLAFGLVQNALEYVGDKRHIIIDGSLMGMGRIPGNLCTELISNYLNTYCDAQYDLVQILDLIENDIMSIYTDKPWGYSVPYFLSARSRVHRSYSEHLLKKDITLNQMRKILEQIDDVHAKKFSKDYLEQILLRTK